MLSESSNAVDDLLDDYKDQDDGFRAASRVKQQDHRNIAAGKRFIEILGNPGHELHEQITVWYFFPLREHLSLG